MNWTHLGASGIIFGSNGIKIESGASEAKERSEKRSVSLFLTKVGIPWQMEREFLIMAPKRQRTKDFLGGYISWMRKGACQGFPQWLPPFWNN